MTTATFRFYEELNDFRAPERRGHEFATRCARAATAKHMIEALGVPHTEVELVLVNGESVGFERALADGDRVAVYPKFEAIDITPLLRVREQPLRETRFVADAHLGGLAHLLRMTGFDTLYDNHFHDAEIERLAHAQQRIVLTRDRELLKRRGISHGCYVRALHAEAQLREVFDRLDLARSARALHTLPELQRLVASGGQGADRLVAAAARAGALSPLQQLRRLRAYLLGRLTLAPHARTRRRAACGTYMTEAIMDQDTFNLGIRKFLKTVGVASQREIEQAVAKAVADGTIAGTETLSVTMTLTVDALQLDRTFDGKIALE
jgi:hypothetical protein